MLTAAWGTLWRGLDRLTAARDVTVSLALKPNDERTSWI